MELTAEQKKILEGWVKEGTNLSDIQKRLQSEFGISMTYMDVRLLVIELGLTLKETKKQPAVVSIPSDNVDAQMAGSGRGVTVDVDRVTRPGSLLSGTVTFSDGVKANWLLDEYGRLAIDAGRRKYSPGEADLQAFQTELQKVLEKHGY